LRVFFETLQLGAVSLMDLGSICLVLDLFTDLLLLGDLLDDVGLIYFHLFQLHQGPIMNFIAQNSPVSLFCSGVLLFQISKG
jgi:hypothetical protein